MTPVRKRTKIKLKISTTPFPASVRGRPHTEAAGNAPRDEDQSIKVPLQGGRAQEGPHQVFSQPSKQPYLHSYVKWKMRMLRSGIVVRTTSMSFFAQMPKGTRASKGILRAVDMTEAEYREIDPRGVAGEAEEQIKGGKQQQQQRSPKKNTTPTFLASTRTKALEETPIPPKRASKGDKTGEKEEEGESQSSMEDLLCLNYGGGGGPKAKSSKSPSEAAAADLSEYLSPSPGGRPLYSRLLRDEIEAADRRLLEDARRAKQGGGSLLL